MSDYAWGYIWGAVATTYIVPPISRGLRWLWFRAFPPRETAYSYVRDMANPYRSPPPPCPACGQPRRP